MSQGARQCPHCTGEVLVGHELGWVECPHCTGLYSLRREILVAVENQIDLCGMDSPFAGLTESESETRARLREVERLKLLIEREQARKERVRVVRLQFDRQRLDAEQERERAEQERERAEQERAVNLCRKSGHDWEVLQEWLDTVRYGDGGKWCEIRVCRRCGDEERND